MPFEVMIQMSDVESLICSFQTFLILKPNFKSHVSKYVHYEICITKTHMPIKHFGYRTKSVQPYYVHIIENESQVGQFRICLIHLILYSSPYRCFYINYAQVYSST